MSGAPQFPTPGWVGAQPLRPGASAHKAGLSLEQRIAALENGAASRPGPGVVDGSIPIADATAQGGLTWSETDNYQRRLLYQAHGFKFGSTGVGTTYILGSDSSTSVASPLSTATTLYTIPILRLDDADHAVAGKTLKLTLDCSIGVNATAPGVNITFALLPIASIGGAANALSFTYGTSLATTTFTTPTASQHAFASTTIDFPADGPHVIGVAFANNQTANSMVSFTGRVYASLV